MQDTWMPGKLEKKHKTHANLMTPVDKIMPDITPLLSGCNRHKMSTATENDGQMI